LILSSLSLLRGANCKACRHLQYERGINMRGCFLNFALATVAGLIAIPLPASAVPTCPSGAVCIDESVEGANPTITGPTGTTSTVTPVVVAVGEEWTITITVPTLSSSGGTGAFGLIEPNSGGLLSDALVNQSGSSNSTNSTFTASLFSGNDLGQIGNPC